MKPGAVILVHERSICILYQFFLNFISFLAHFEVKWWTSQKQPFKIIKYVGEHNAFSPLANLPNTLILSQRLITIFYCLQRKHLKCLHLKNDLVFFNLTWLNKNGQKNIQSGLFFTDTRVKLKEVNVMRKLSKMKEIKLYTESGVRFEQ